MWDSLSVISTLALHKDSVRAHLVITPYVIVIYDVLCHASLDAALTRRRFIAKKLRLNCCPVLSCPVLTDSSGWIDIGFNAYRVYLLIDARTCRNNAATVL